MSTDRILVVSLLAALMTACGGGGNDAETADSEPTSGDETTTTATADEAPADDIVDTAVAAGQFNTLVAAVQAAGLEETLRGPGPFTVFAPTDEAFAALPEGTVDTLLQPENRERLVAVLTYHVVDGDVRAEQVVGMSAAPTLQGGELAISTAVEGSRRRSPSSRFTVVGSTCGGGEVGSSSGGNFVPRWPVRHSPRRRQEVPIRGV